MWAKNKLAFEIKTRILLFQVTAYVKSKFSKKVSLIVHLVKETLSLKVTSATKQ